MRKISILVPLLLILISFNSTDSFGQFTQQGEKLVGSGGSDDASQGYSVSISADGNTAIIGGPYDSFNGAAWIFNRNQTLWSQQGGKLVEPVGFPPTFGTAVSISADGNTAVVGGYGINRNEGAAWVFVRNGSSWSQQGTSLIGSGAIGKARQGISVCISGDGNTIIVGGSSDSSASGAAWIFVRDSGNWIQQGGKLVGSGAVGMARQGISVSLSGDGNTAMVGGDHDSSFKGATWIFTRNGGVWTQQGSKLVGSGAVNQPSSALQGSSVALSADGNTAIEGAYSDDADTGAAWVFVRNAGVWTQQGSKLVGIGRAGSTRQGVSVSLSGDGNIAIVGGLADSSYFGAAWMYVRRGGAWSQLGNKLVGTGAEASPPIFPNQGQSVCISEDGNTTIVGGPSDKVGRGAAWVYIFQRLPVITNINDNPNDQGGKLEVLWNHSALDGPDTSSISSYIVFRKPLFEVGATTRTKRILRNFSIDSSLFGYDSVGSIPASMLPEYSMIVPTAEDSVLTGIHRYAFIVVAVESDSGNYLISSPDSGYSVDNLVPGPPLGLEVAVQSGSHVRLLWGEPSDPDIGGYIIYRSTEYGFTPEPGLIIGTAFTTSFIDSTPAVEVSNYYRVVTSDVHGNLSQPSSIVFAPLPVSKSFIARNGWNIVSVPLTVNDYSTSIIYPTAISPAYTYQFVYVISETLQNAAAYWLMFDSAQSISMSGLLRISDTLVVSPGWNLVGSISTPIAISSITSNPGGMSTSHFFSYSGIYQIVDTLHPGNGYWVKVNQSGQLLLSPSPAIAKFSRIRITAGFDSPPPPPEGGMSRNENLARVFALEQNYPNPFNPQTSFRYEIAREGKVQLKIFDANGRQVATLVDEIQGPGEYTRSWNANGFSSGVYFYKLVAGSFTEVKKLLLIR